MPPPPVTLTFDLLTLKVVSESCVTWATSVSILVFLNLSVLDLDPMYATDSNAHHRIMPAPYGGVWALSLLTKRGVTFVHISCHTECAPTNRNLNPTLCVALT